jgi:putative FmdB family regulatory protein
MQQDDYHKVFRKVWNRKDKLMPIYEYKCAECQTSQEITRGFDDEEKIPPCPRCGYEMKRIYNTFGIHFNGPGFYSTGG